MPSDFGLTVRRHERHQLSLAGLVSVGEHPEPSIGVAEFGGGRLRFSPESGVSESGFQVTIVDLGAGGLGFVAPHFIPRGAVIRVRMLGDSGSHADLRLDATVRVQRVTMTDRKPTYLYGTSFVNAGPALLEKVKTLIAKFAPALPAAIASAPAGGGAC